MAKILLAEDDEAMLEFLKLALERAGHDIIDFDNGSTALKHITSTNDTYDLLLSDVVMPGIDGIELAQKVTELQPDIKVMFITGFAAMAMKDLGDENMKQQPQMLSKPFHLNDLVEQIEELLSTK